MSSLIRPANSIASIFWENAREFGDSPAFLIADGDQVIALNWRQVAFRVSVADHFLTQKGLTSGQHVATCLPNSLDWIAIDLACQTIGCVHVALDPRIPTSLRSELVTHSCAAHAVLEPFPAPGKWLELEANHTSDFLSRARSIPAEHAAQILYTSGTVDAPKGVVLSHRNLVSNATAKLVAAPQVHSDVRINLLPFSHAYARTCELSTWILSRSRLAIASNWDELLRQARCLQPTLLNIVPFLAHRIIDKLSQDRAALGNRMRLLQIGGAAVSDEVFAKLAQAGLPPLQGYGLTEASPVVCSNRAGEQRPGTVGRPVPGTEVRRDPDGVLWTRGDHVMHGYWNAETATQSVLVDGWLCTGDLAEMDADGFVRILGRQSEQISLSTGYMVSPEEVESRLLQDDWLEQAVVIGDGEPRVTAWVWPKIQVLPPQFFSSSSRSRSTLLTAEWLETMQHRLSSLFQDLPVYMQPREIAVLPTILSLESGTLTSKGTPKRRRVAELTRNVRRT